MYSSESDKLTKFLKLRNEYIDLLESGKLSKIEFNRKNNDIFKKINLRPFSVLDSFDKALYNYNYYNSRAKLCLEDCNKYKQERDSRSLRRAKMAENNKLNNYFHKDEAIIAMIENGDKNFIEAYYINMHSKSLSELIYEIHFLNKHRVILHSKNPKIKEMLIKLNLFLKEPKDSLIASYINN